MPVGGAGSLQTPALSSSSPSSPSSMSTAANSSTAAMYATTAASPATTPARSDLSQTSKRFSDLIHLSAGGISSAIGKSCTAPLSRLTILMQVQGMAIHHHHLHSLPPPSAYPQRPSPNPNGGLLREASRIASEEGVRAFWKGNSVTILHRLPFASISFYSYEAFKNALSSSADSWNNARDGRSDEFEGQERIATTSTRPALSFSQRILAGGAAAATAICTTYPLDLVRTRLAAQKTETYYKGILHALLKIPKDEGARSLYKGMGATLLSTGPSITINFCVYETLKAELSHRMTRSPTQDQTAPSPFLSLACGSISGFASSTVTFPLDVVRRRRQLEGAAGSFAIQQPEQKRSILGMVVQIARREGFFRGLYRGILPEYLKVVPSVAITFTTYEFLKSAFADK